MCERSDIFFFRTYSPKNLTLQHTQANKTWREKAIIFLYWFSMGVCDSIIMHIQDAKSPKSPKECGYFKANMP
jgi:hypothetical protein